MNDVEEAELRSQLKAAEQDAYDAAETLRSLQTSLEIVANLAYLVSHSQDDPKKSSEYWHALDVELQQLWPPLNKFFRAHRPTR
jgi:hypothetical protein